MGRTSIFLSKILSLAGVALAASPKWEFVQNGTSGVLALEAIVVSPTLAIFMDRATNDPLMINGAPAWASLWNFRTNTATALKLITDSFCASGGFLSNGTMVGNHFKLRYSVLIGLHINRSASAEISLSSQLHKTAVWAFAFSNLATTRTAKDVPLSKTPPPFTWLQIDGIHLLLGFSTDLWYVSYFLLRIFLLKIS